MGTSSPALVQPWASPRLLSKQDRSSNGDTTEDKNVNGVRYESKHPNPGARLHEPQNKSQNVAHFSVFKNSALSDHTHHANHHKLTTKTPHFDTTFSPTPSKNARKTSKIRSHGRLKFFPQKFKKTHSLFRLNQP
jgi:hypothetical protein